MRSAQNRNACLLIIGLTKILQNNSVWKIVVASYICSAAITCMGFSNADEGVYISITATSPKRLAVSYNKAVDNTDPKNVSTQHGKVNVAESSATEIVGGMGDVIGYRLPLTAGFFLSGEVDLAYLGGSVRGNIMEVGDSEGANQLGESWSEEWTFERKFSYGLTLKLGGSPGILRSWKTSIYALTGVRQAKSRFEAGYNGCFKPEPCVVGEYDSGVFNRDHNSIAWATGVGVEKMVRGSIGLQVEGRYISYNTGKWVTSFPDLGVKVTSELANHDVGLMFLVFMR